MSPEETTKAAEPPPPPIQAELVSPKGRATVELVRILAEHPEHADYLKGLVEAETQRELFDQDYRTARIYALSGKFDDIKGETPEQAIASAMTKIRIGREWGLCDSDSVAFIYWTNGRPAVMTEILATKIQQAGFNWDIEWHWEDAKSKNSNKPYKRCTGCTLWLKQFNSTLNQYQPVKDRNGNDVSASFTEADADNAEIWEKGKQIPLSQKWNFKAWAQDMFFWRAMGRLRKYYLTGVMRGAVQAEIAYDYPPPTAPAELPAPAPEAEAVTEPERKALRERILQQGEQGDLLESK